MAGAAATVPVHAAVRSALGWPPRSADTLETHERYLVALSTAAHPSTQLVKGEARAGSVQMIRILAG